VHYTSGSSYSTLCDEARAGGHTVKLMRDGQGGWGLQVVVRPASDTDGWRAVGVLFPEVEELDLQARHLLAWLRTSARAV